MKKTYGFLLAGGKARRMGGCNKGLTPFLQQPLAARSIELLKQRCDEVFISANRDLDAFRQFGVPVIPDQEPWIDIGPLGGLASLCRQVPWSSASLVQLLPCDVPFLTPSILDALDRAQQALQRPVYAQHGDHWHPLISCWPARSLEGLEDYLRSTPQRAVIKWLQRCDAAPVLFSDAQHFVNINDQQALNFYSTQALRHDPEEF